MADKGGRRLSTDPGAVVSASRRAVPRRATSPRPAAAGTGTLETGAAVIIVRQRPAALAPRLTGDEREAHRRLVAELGDKALWLKLAAFGAPVAGEAVASG